MVSRQLATYKAGEAVASALPGGVARGVAEALGRCLARVPDFDGRRALVASHLRRVMGRDLSPIEQRRLTGEVYANYARYWAESLRLPSVAPATVMAGTSSIGRTHVDDALARGKGVVLVAPHLGGWEWGALSLTLEGLPVTVAVEPLRPDDLFRWFARYRESLGMQVVPVGPRAAASILKALSANHIVCLLADRLVGRSAGVEVSFFGAKARLPAGPVTLALRSGAALMTAAIYYGRAEGPHTIVYRPPIDLPLAGIGGQGGFRLAVAEGTQLVATELESLISEAPTQWHLLQPNWLDDPPLRSRRRAAPSCEEGGRPAQTKT